MQKQLRMFATLALSAGTFGATACGGNHDASRTATANGDVAPSATAAPTTSAPVAPADTMRQDHHSKLAGAAVGAVVGHALGHHAAAGAAAGALIQHARNHKHR